MIKVKVKYVNNNTEIEFPIDESNLLSQLQTLFKDENDKQFSKSTKFLIDEVIEPRGLSVIKNSVVNLDELNYLAKRMDSFVEFYIITWQICIFRFFFKLDTNDCNAVFIYIQREDLSVIYIFKWNIYIFKQ